MGTANNKRNKKWGTPVYITAGVLALMLISPMAVAQSSEVNIKQSEISELKDVKPKKKISESGSVERIKVTGSHIKRIDIEGPSPIMVIDRTDLEKTGYNSVSDVLRDTTVSSFGSTRERAGSSTAGVAHVNLRGMGSDRTLVLLNGKRLPADAISGAVDLNLIPMAAVERIEILKDGASATYGSDALGGVVNIITLKDFTGTEVSVNGSYSQYTDVDKDSTPDRFDGSVVNGSTFGKVNLVNVVHFRKNDQIFARDRKWSDNGISSIGDTGSFRQINGDDTVGKWVVDPSCPVEMQKTTGAGTVCTYRYSDHSTILPKMQQTSVMSEASVDVGESTNLKFRAAYIDKETSYIYAPAAGVFKTGLGAGTAPAGVDNTNGMHVRYRLSELGNRVSEAKTDSANFTLGGTTEVGESWEVEYNTSYNRVHRMDKGVSGYALRDVLLNLIKSGKVDLLKPKGLRGDFSSAKYVPYEESESVVQATEIVASGEILEGASGPWSLATGTSITKQSYKDEFDQESLAENVFGNAGGSGGGKREIQALFSELSIPMTEKLEVQLAARYDNYSDFGDTLNPKLAFKYQVSPKLLFRGSAGTGFKAPNMTDMYAASSLGYPTVIDHKKCQEDKAAGIANPDSCNPQQYEMTSSGNPGLKEENSINYNVGAILQPTEDMSFGFDLWMTKLDNVVGLSLDDALKAEAAGADLAAANIDVVRDSNGNIETINAPIQNLASREVFGIDLNHELRVWKLRFAISHSHLFHYKQEGFSGVGSRNILGENGTPQWRNNIVLGITPAEGHDASFTYKTIDGHEKSVPEEGRLRQYSELDFQYTYAFSSSGEISIGVKNLLGATPPLDETSPNNQLDSTLYSQMGTTSYLTAKTSF